MQIQSLIIWIFIFQCDNFEMFFQLSNLSNYGRYANNIEYYIYIYLYVFPAQIFQYSNLLQIPSLKAHKDWYVLIFQTSFHFYYASFIFNYLAIDFIKDTDFSFFFDKKFYMNIWIIILKSLFYRNTFSCERKSRKLLGLHPKILDFSFIVIFCNVINGN